jgi:nitroreductase
VNHVFRINRRLEPGQYRLVEVFPDIQTCEILLAVFADSAELDQVIERTTVHVVDQSHDIFVDNDDGSITIGLPHLRQVSDEILYLDIIHELCHVKQHLQGRDLYDRSKAYVDRETEIEAYQITVREARRIGLSDDTISDYLQVPWITAEEHRRLACRLCIAETIRDDGYNHNLSQERISMLQLLRERRSIRKFKKDQVAQTLIDGLKEAALRSPSSRGKNPWKFFFVQDAAVIKALSRSKEHGSSFLENAPLAVVVCGDETVSDVWIEDCSIAAAIVHLAAHSLGLGSCWIQIRNRKHDTQTTSEDYIRKVVNIAASLKILSIIAIGYPDESKAGHPSASLDHDKVVA